MARLIFFLISLTFVASNAISIIQNSSYWYLLDLPIQTNAVLSWDWDMTCFSIRDMFGTRFYYNK
jgi:hypothetical protein